MAKSRKIISRKARPEAQTRLSDAKAMMLFESNRKSTGVAFALWFFLGFFGGHRFYFGQIGTAIIMLLLTISVFGSFITAIWWIIDAFTIPGKIRDYNNRLTEAISRGGVVLPRK